MSIALPLITSWHLCETLVPIVIGVVVDRGIAGGELSQFLPTLLLVVATFLILATSYRLASRSLAVAVEDEGHQLRTEIAGHVLHPRGARTKQLPGEVLSIATSDASLVPEVFSYLAFATAASVSLAAVATYLLVVDAVVGLTILIGVPAVVLIIQIATPLVARRTHTQQERTAEATGLATDLVQGLRPLKGIGGEDVAMQRYRHSSGAAAAATVGLARSRGYLTGLTTGLSGVLLAAVVALAGARALDGQLSVGEFIAIVGLTQFLAEPISQLGEVSAEMARSRASAQRIATFLDSPPLVAAGDSATQGSPPRLVMDQVTAGPLLGLDLQLGEEVVALVVEDPAASDVLMDVLAGERAIDDGQITLGGAALATVSIRSRRAAVVVASHRTSVMEGSLRRVVDPGADLDPARLDSVLRASAATDVIALHPDGLDRVVAAEGSSLSGGQRQRLVLARALAADPPLLVLQDPTSAVDAVTEQNVATGLTELRRGLGRSTLILTSSPALLRAADRVLHVRDGRVVAHGTHDELLDDPLYRSAVLR